jgi:hypothetical protein
MLYCTIHTRCFVPRLKRWLPADPVQVQGVSHAIPVVEGCCDCCIHEAKTSLFTQFPDLYVQCPKVRKGPQLPRSATLLWSLQVSPDTTLFMH